MTGIEFKNVSKFYGEVLGLNDVSFFIPKGITGLVGSNGAGKSTTMKLCVSIIKPDLGEVTYQGESIWNNLAYLKKVGYATEKDKLFEWMTGYEFLKWNARLLDLHGTVAETRIKEILELMDLSHAKDRKIQGYSRGMRQRVKIGQTLLHEPELIFVDEPMSGTDPLGRYTIAETFRRVYKDEGRSVILSSHVLHELERLSTWLLILENGKLVAEGTMHGIREAMNNVPQHFIITSPNVDSILESLVDQIIEFKRLSPYKIQVAAKNREALENSLVEIQQDQHIEINEFLTADADLSAVYRLLKNGNRDSWRYLA
ncbi:MAG: ABC transporter ATP-binding protein [Methanobacteriota archaeon]|nr:MAG: ABC transporter ATP-binding protein [Euryarchaeota archaeon]